MRDKLIMSPAAIKMLSNAMRVFGFEKQTDIYNAAYTLMAIAIQGLLNKRQFSFINEQAKSRETIRLPCFSNVTEADKNTPDGDIILKYNPETPIDSDTEEGHKIINALQKLCKLNNREFINNSLTIFEAATKAILQGKEIATVDAQKENIQTITMDCFKQIRPANNR